MMKNSNKKAGNWGALKNKPQNQVYFKTGGKVKLTAGGEKHVIYKKTTKRGEGKVGNIMVNHPTKDKGSRDIVIAIIPNANDEQRDRIWAAYSPKN